MKTVIKKIKNKPILTFSILFYILFLLSSVCSIYSILKISNVENFLRYIGSFFIFLLSAYMLILLFKIVLKGKNPAIILYDIIIIILFIILSYLSVTINGLYNSISSVYKDTQTFSISLITLKENNFDNINDIKNKKIGILDNSINVELNELSNEIINENNLNNNELIEYETSSEILNDLYNKKIDCAFVEKDYVSLFSNIENYKNIDEETIQIISKSKTVKKDLEINNKNIDEPFTLLLLGMDSTVSDISQVTSFNADSLILITFNPKTYNATILSIPRDTYVPIACLNNNIESKITHSGWGGEKCVINTIESWMDIKIDYYAKVNFTALVKLVDEIGGIEVDVPYSFCEQNSQRQWGENTIYVKKGLQLLNGEQALALSRNRHPNPTYCSSEWTNYYSDDIIRGENQQKVLNALINKLIKNIDLDKIYSIFDIIGKNVDTNMQINEITAYYSTLKNIALKTLTTNKNIINFEKLSLQTYGKNIYDFALNIPGISMQIYYKESFNQIVKAMKENLNEEKPTIIKTFNFSINEPYVEKTIGTGTFNQDDIHTLPNFIGKDISELESWALNNNIEYTIKYEDSYQDDNIILNQNIPATYRLDKINTILEITVSNKVEEIIDENTNEEDLENNIFDEGLENIIS